LSSANDMLDRFRRDGDEEAFADLMEACRPAVTAACRQRLIDLDDVDDAVQETFVKLACRAGSIRGDVRAWLHSAAVTTAIDFTRRAARRHHLLLGASDGLLERPESLSWEAIQHRLAGTKGVRNCFRPHSFSLPV
jgi:RNA polymerase sigma factor (sigma-70 family)